MENYPYERVSIYSQNRSSYVGDSGISQFRHESGNSQFRTTVLTWINLAILLLVYPALSVLGMGEDTASLFKNMTQGVLAIVLITTIAFQWVIFGVNYGGVYTEGTGLAGLGFKKIRLVDFAWAVAFLVAANVSLGGLAWFLAQVGMPMPGEIALLIPTDPFGKVIWVLVSLTAGICEETAFRGYLMTRLRLLGKFNSWVIPTIISAVAFGICHAYQGIPGFIVITVYGVMFSILYIRTGTLWPCIIAHALQDFGALIWPH